MAVKHKYPFKNFHIYFQHRIDSLYRNYMPVILLYLVEITILTREWCFGVNLPSVYAGSETSGDYR